MNKLSTSQLATYMKVTKRTIQRRSIRENWPFEEQEGLGGIRKMYIFSGLPISVRQVVTSRIITKHKQQGLNYEANKPKEPHMASALNLSDSPFIVLNQAEQGDWISQHSFAHELDITECDKEYIRVGIMVLVRLYILSFSLGKIKGLDEFCRLYNERKLALNETVYNFVGRVSRITLLRWEKQQHLNGTTHDILISNSADRILFDYDIQQIAKEILVISPDTSAKQFRQYFMTIFPQRKIPSVRRLSMWIKRQKELAASAQTTS